MVICLFEEKAIGRVNELGGGGQGGDAQHEIQVPSRLCRLCERLRTSGSPVTLSF